MNKYEKEIIELLEKEHLLSLTDEERLNLIKNASTYHELYLLVLSLDSDEYKLQMLPMMDILDKKNVIMTLKSDELKMKYINTFTNPFDILLIATSLKSKDFKLKLLHENNEKYDLSTKAEIIKSISFENDEEIFDTAKLFSNNYLKLKILEKLEIPENKEKAINLLNSDFSKRDIILSLPPEYRLCSLSKSNIDNYSDDIIDSIEDDTIKISSLNHINDEKLISKILSSLKDDKLKLQFVKCLKKENYVADVLASLDSDELKSYYLPILRTQQNFYLVAMSINDKELLRDLFPIYNKLYSKIGLDKNITLGIEIETEGEKSTNIDRLHSFIKCTNNETTRCWETHPEITLEDGLEIASPILSDNKTDIEEIYLICEMLKNCDQNATENCAAHIHIGSDYLKSIDSYINLLEIWGNAEELIFYMSNNIGEIPRENYLVYSSFISPKLEKAIMDGAINFSPDTNLNTFISDLQKIQGGRYTSINFLNINNNQNTIEFRFSNGTLDPNVWIENARLYGRIVEVSEKLAQIQKKIYPSPEEQKLIMLKNKLKTKIPNNEKIDIFLDLLFDENEKTIYKNRFDTNYKLFNNLHQTRKLLNSDDFSCVDFKESVISNYKELPINEER